MNSYNVISENSDVDLSAHLLVKFTATGVDKAGATDVAIGTVLNDTKAGKAAAVALRKSYGLHDVTLGNNTAVAVGDELDQYAGGTVIKAAGGKKAGVARQAATGTGAIIEAYLYPDAGAGS